MKLIEKKCPNCGGSLEFSETAKSCKCEYCHRAFEIERDEKVDVSDLAEQFNLSELKAPLKAVSTMFIGSRIVFAIIFIFVIAMFIFIGSQIYTDVNGGSYYSDVEQFDNDDYGDFDHKAYMTISENDDNLNDFSLELNVKRQKVYLIYDKKGKTNTIYVVYKAGYKKNFDKNRTFIYVPIKYEKLKRGTSLVFQLDNGKVEAPEYYLTEDKSEFTYGYNDIETFENEVIKPLEKKYQVTKK
ncbi:MAG: hypothetical protein IJI58_02690 [Bacilli bacterium]|nr:hypothetical protein [Bacilli bacterium]